MKLSEQAALTPQPMAIDQTDRDHARELWRVKAMEWSGAEDRASRLEEGRKLLMDQAVLNMVAGDPKLSMARAEKEARTSEEFKIYLRKMHDARRVANDLKIDTENLNRLYWEIVGQAANARAEMRMTGR